MFELYRDQSGDPKRNAQLSLQGRTHYVDNDTLRGFKSRVISAHPVDGGLLFAIVTSDALNRENTHRGFRYVIFDLFGNVIERTEIEKAYRTSEKACKAMWDALNAIDAQSITREGLARRRAAFESECSSVEKLLAE